MGWLPSNCFCRSGTSKLERRPLVVKRKNIFLLLFFFFLSFSRFVYSYIERETIYFLLNSVCVCVKQRNISKKKETNQIIRRTL